MEQKHTADVRTIRSDRASGAGQLIVHSKRDPSQGDRVSSKIFFLSGGTGLLKRLYHLKEGGALFPFRFDTCWNYANFLTFYAK
jgi:hypothetical protein